ncbi:hypothetical protein LSCM4_04691 [Leishmania orientalis]|uniref:Uncharacterized protein n=1 Tax=Leishmania orientalis TaxID=2249476 RepID=A0A836HBK4_9TRYP|nr:hypothetical protein LSCM4_04691 [Leishmania orientalis]
MKLFHVVSRRRTLRCVAAVLLFAAVTLACVRAQDAAASSAAAATDAVGEPFSQENSMARKASASAAGAAAREEAEAAAEREREAERHRDEAREKARQRRGNRRHVAEAEERYRKAAERRQRREETKRTIDSVDQIRFAASELPEGCAGSVEEYLFRAHEHRQKLATAVRDTRSELNEARVHAPKRVAKLEKKLAAKLDDLLVYDIETLRLYGGNVPKTCIAESQAWLNAQSQLFSTSDTVQVCIYLLRILSAHFRLLGQTVLGVANYMIKSYAPAVASYTKSAQHYYDTAKAMYAELLPATGEWPDVPMTDLAKRAAVMVGYAAVPVGLGVTVGIVAVILLPPVATAMVMYECVYKVWAELFFAYYIYGMRLPSGIVAAIKSTAAAAQAGRWAYISGNIKEAFTGLLVDADTVFYNAVIAFLMLVNLVVIGATFICVWCCFCIPGMRGRRRASPLKSVPRSTSGSSNGSKKKPAATAGAAGAAGAAAKKKS